MLKIEFGGAAASYTETGTGPAVVLLHAGIADHRMWRSQLPVLAAAGYRAIAYDLPGYGGSAIPAVPFAYHDAVAQLLDALDIGPAVLVGCSFGGRVAIDTALAHPGRVSALALFGTALSGQPWSAEFQQSWQRFVGTAEPDALAEAEVRFWVVGPGREPADVDPELIEFAVELDRGALAGEALLEATEVRELEPPAVGRLGEIRVPTLVGVGADDLPDVIALADRIAARVPTAQRLPDVPDAAHLLPLERPEPVNRALLDLLARVHRPVS